MGYKDGRQSRKHIGGGIGAKIIFTSNLFEQLIYGCNVLDK